jgi:hypothetical protein
MPRFHFHLRAHGTIHLDLEGTDLPNLAASHAHAVAVADELLRHSAARTRHWSICVEDNAGEVQFDVFLADLDPSLASWPPEIRMLVTQTCRRLGALTDALRAVRRTQIETQRLLARARRKPQLVYARGR